MEQNLPAHARAIVIGGGVIGCSVAYHLIRLGWEDVILLEQGKLSGGTSWHAAGLVGRLRTSTSMTLINQYTAELYARLEAETGVTTGWRQCGSLIIGRSAERMIQLKRTVAMARVFGIEAELIHPQRVSELWPLLRTDDIQGGVWLPEDGRVHPGQVTLALAAGARQRGVRIFEGVRVTGFKSTAHSPRSPRRLAGVITDQGEISAEHVVLCGGMWTRQLAQQAGLHIPLHPVEHHYIVSAPIAGVHEELPVGRDPDLMIYFRPEAGGIMLGAFQKESTPWLVERVPDDFSFQLLDADWPKYQQPLAAGQHLIPALQTTEWTKFVNGPESFTPDNNFILGETALRGCWVAAGFNSLGIASAGGAGKALAEWMTQGAPSMDLWSVDVRRFLPWSNNRRFLRVRAGEVLGLHYQMAWPNREYETGRGIRRSPIHDRLAAAGACFGQKNGWERPLFFARNGASPTLTYGWGRQNWFDDVAAECQATRERVAIFDQTSFSKYRLQGSDAVMILQQLCANDVDVTPGRIVYTTMLNEQGGIESDLTVMRVTPDSFDLVSGAVQTQRDLDWISRHIPAGADAHLSNTTSHYAVLSVMGPRARDLMQQVSDADFSNPAFPFGAVHFVNVGLATALAVRISYVGELGWELHIPVEQMAAAYEALWTAGQAWGVVNAGHYAINSLRLEKGYLAWGADLSPDETPLEAGLEFAVAWEKRGTFHGRLALLRQRERGLTKRIAAFVLQEPEATLWGNEPICRNGEVVGYTTSGAYGYTLGGAVGVGYIKNAAGVDDDFVLSGDYAIETNGVRVPAKVYLRSPYDPQRTKIKAE
jgi:glycine cleavage system aminomethyltransferase T/glycine/D-amino acid oxidase-like deaminating enzyme